MAWHIFAAEVSHENAPSHIREKLAGDDESVKACTNFLRKSYDEVFILSTYNRFLVYTIGESIDPLLNFFLQDPDLIRYAQFHRNTEASVNHLFAMASGLCSLIKGEQQILLQIRQAHQLALEWGSIGLKLDHLLHDAVRVGKKVRTETGIDKFCSVVVDAGFELIYDKLQNIYNRNFLIVGTGKIAHLTLDYLRHEGIQNITLTSHDFNRAAELAMKYNARAVPIAQSGQYFQQADVIVGGMLQHEVSLCLESPGRSWIRYLDNFDPWKNYIVLDFGMPRSFYNKLQELPSVELYDLDDLKVRQSSLRNVFSGVEEAWKIVEAEAQAFLNILQRLEMVPILAAYWTRLVNLKDQQMNWRLPKLENATEQDIQLIKMQARKLMHNVSRESLKKVRTLASDIQADITAAEIKSISHFRSIKLDLLDN